MSSLGGDYFWGGRLKGLNKGFDWIGFINVNVYIKDLGFKVLVWLFDVDVLEFILG